MRIVRFAPLLLCIAAVTSCKDSLGEAPDAPNPQCSDGIDNDSDGLIDYPADPGCSSPDDMTEDSFGPPACSNGKDDDGDGLIDYPNDPGCLAPQQDSEDDDCPSGPNCPQCANGIDDDGNGQTDYPADTGCTAASDDDEFTLPIAACGTGLSVQQLPPTLMASGMLDTTMGTITGLSDTCGVSASTTLPAAAYLLTLPVAKVVTVTTQGSAADTILDIRKTDCSAADAVIACDDDVTLSNKTSSVTTSLTAGHYILLVMGRTTGEYRLKVTEFAGQGASCFMPTDCGPGLVCRVALGDTAMTCQPHVCSDGVDDDGDGKNDYPDDPGCTTPADDDESDDCPSGPTCPQCANGIDDDGDGHIDYPADPSCTAASSVSESCQSADGVTAITTGSISGDTTSATDDFNPPCAAGAGTGDLVYSLDLPPMKSLHVGVNGSFEPAMELLDATCGTDNTSLACSVDEESIDVSNLPASQYFVVVDGSFNGSVGPFSLTVSGQIRGGGSCEGDLFTAGAITCAGSSTCQGTPGSKICFSECSDGIDNDGDGKIDYPNDPGCDSPDDGTENLVCPGPMCPQCGDGIDNDADGEIDYPNDINCLSASGTSESCVTSEPITVLEDPTTNGTTVGATGDYQPTCSFGTLPEDVLYSMTLPQMNSLSINAEDPTFSSEPTTAILDATCGADSIEVGCAPFQEGVELTNVAAGNYFVDVSAEFEGETGSFILTVSGEIAIGASCESPLAQAGAITCPANYGCGGTVGSRTCMPSQCSDGIDNNGDGLTDWPNDPGCSSPNDPTENTVCPGPQCPACADGIDEDGDTLIDYPADWGCAGAGGTTEQFCTVETDPTSLVTGPTTSGDNTATHNNLTPVCQTNSDNDTVYGFQLPVPASSITFDTETSTAPDTILQLMDTTCNTVIACDDDGGSGTLSNITIPSSEFPNLPNGLPAGNYAIVVDTFSTASNLPFKLNIHAKAAHGTACTSSIFANGIMTCDTGLSCTAGICQ
ncbi:MAG TPA: hypothetical protein VGM88_34335 [Kofleriaceae bacterium]|jgi:hypothetical protein